MVYSDEFLQELIECPKLIVKPLKKSMTELQLSLRNSMELISECRTHRFLVNFRQHSIFSENFSIIVQYVPENDPEKPIILRFNGSHAHRNALENEHWHSEYHIHMATERYIQQGLKSDAYAEITHEYSNFDDAQMFFLQYCNIINARDHFPRFVQAGLFDMEL